MIVALISDIHANAQALRRVVEDARWFAQQFDPAIKVEFWCLGDVVGRGPSPGEVWDCLMKEVQPTAWIAGNWDWALIEKIQNLEMGTQEIGEFKKVFWESLLYQRKLLQDIGEYQKIATDIEALPVLTSPRPGIYMAHGSFDILPAEEVQSVSVSRYLWSDMPYLVKESWRTFMKFLEHPVSHPGLAKPPAGWQRPTLLLAGHTHVQDLVFLDEQPREVLPPEINCWYDLSDNPDRPVYVNPGSVGFPRDDGPDSLKRCAGYALLDLTKPPGRVCFRRVWFDRQHVINQYRKYGYDNALIEIITKGLEGPCIHDNH